MILYMSIKGLVARDGHLLLFGHVGHGNKGGDAGGTKATKSLALLNLADGFYLFVGIVQAVFPNRFIGVSDRMTAVIVVLK